MRIACPSCNAVYQVPDEQLGEGRIVRCARCGTDWSPVVELATDGILQGRAESGAVLPAESLPEPPMTEEPEAPVSRRMVLDEDAIASIRPVPADVTPLETPVAAGRGGPWLAVAWVVSVGVVIGACVWLVAGRETVMHAWAPSIRAYVALGLAARP